MSTYTTFIRSCTNWREFASAKKHVQDTGLTYAEAKRACEYHNAHLTDSDKERGTKMEFTADDSFDHRREASKEESATRKAIDQVFETPSCPQCRGKGKITVTSSVYGSKEPPDKFDMDCPTCNGKGAVTPAGHRRYKRELDAWCKCTEPGDPEYYDHGGAGGHGYT